MSARPETRNIAGMAALALGIFVFSTQDAILKSISGDYAVTQAIVIRSIVALPILAAMVHAESGLRSLISGNFRSLTARGLILLASYTAYYMAFPALPLAEAIALFFVSPIFVTLLAGPLLGENVSLKSWFAVAVGFLGVLFIVRPGSALFEPAALLSLIAAAAYALAMTFARKLGVSEPATVMAFYQNGTYLLGAIVIAGICAALGLTKLGHPSLDFLVRPWVTPTPKDFLLMAACGVIAAVAMSLITQAYRLAEANLVTVLEYTGMIWAPLWGFLFFGEIPRWTTLIGMLLIAAAGLYSLIGAAAGKPGISYRKRLRLRRG
ncbi:EamA domain-containing membrane protein RarD [Rhizobiales bacterium GAS191]|nr:EamA domain-containing membrane protein RarD [Rhizobiales bacterium GAS113]SEE71617.1 EamA domain-containing membrane protein RarD [Rhizobiales bacterium GAS191]